MRGGNKGAQAGVPVPLVRLLLVGGAKEQSRHKKVGYCLKTRGGPFISLASRAMVTSTWSAILMKGMPLFMP